MAISGLMVGKMKKTETTIQVLDMWPENMLSVLNIQNKFLRWIVTRISHWHYRQADKLIAMTQAMKKQLQIATSIQEEKITVIPQTCEKLYEEDIFDQDLHDKYKDFFTIVFAGNISPAQSFPAVISAAQILKDKGYEDIRWIIIGDGMSRQWLEDEVHRHNLDEYFIFEGLKPIEEIPRYTKIADALLACMVKSELYEATLPAKAISYLAAGRPLLLAMDGDMRDIVNQTQCGFAGPTEDVDALVNNIIALYKMTPQERDEMGQRARDHYFKYFERNLILKQMKDFIES